MKALVTGGGGFLGSAIVKALRQKGHSVKTIQRGDYPFLTEWGAESITGDLTNLEDVILATKSCDMVFHVAAKAGVWGDYNEYYLANVVATKNVISACKKNNITSLVYTSTPSVVFDGRDEHGIDESAPYSRLFFNAYQQTKAIAEQCVLAANSHDFKTVALRPHLIWGARDPHLVPRIIKRAKAGRLRLVGTQNKQVDSCYIDNAVHAHILAAECLRTDAQCAGKAYFISNDEPLTMATLINKILNAAEMPLVSKTLNANTAYYLGVIFEKLYTLLRIKQEPPMTRFIAKQLACAHWFNLTAAKRDFAYAPKITVDEGIKRLHESLLRQRS